MPKGYEGDRVLLTILNDNAACREAPPELFSATTHSEAEQALAYCADCTVRKPCLQVVRPGPSYFDGVAGGKVWSEGRLVKRNKP